jgi:hypothetical protein
MATRKKRKKAVYDGPRPGRKKDIKRFELEKWSGGDAPDDVLKPNEVAFVVRTSGGTPLNASDVNKISRSLQHQLRGMGHKLKRKGQPLDPPEPKNSDASPAESEPEPGSEKGEDTTALSSANGYPAADDAPSPDGDLSGYSSPKIADLSDPDDPHPNQ